MPTIEIEQLCKRFQTEAETRVILSGVDLRLDAGESLAVMGPSGSGKSTLLNIVGTLDRPDSGTVRIRGVDPFALNDAALAAFRNSTLGFIFQSHHLLPQCSVLENVLLPSVLCRKDRSESAQVRALRLLERVGLKDRLHDRPARLSGGERQRTAVVRALINQPQVLLADEPTGSLDHAAADVIGALLAQLKSEENVALIVVTHTRELARCMDRTLHLRDGVLQPDATAPVTAGA